MRIRKIISTTRVCTARPEGNERYVPSYGEYSSITIDEKIKYQLEVRQASKTEVASKRIDASWERLLRKVSDSRASQRLFND